MVNSGMKRYTIRPNRHRSAPTSSLNCSVAGAAAGKMENLNLILSIGIFNTRTGTCGTACDLCSGLTDTLLDVCPNPADPVACPDPNAGSPASINLTVGSSAQSFVMGDSNGVTADVTSMVTSWSDDAGSVATIGPTGMLTGVGGGSTTVFASFYGKLPSDGCDPESQGYCTQHQHFVGTGTASVISATITVHFTGTKTQGTPGDTLVFQQPGSVACSESLGLFNCSNTSAWLWNVEGEAVVSDVSSNWTVKQGYTGRKKGFWKDSSNTLHNFDDPLNVPNDNPSSSAVLRVSGQKLVFWIDDPGHFYTYTNGFPVDSMTQVQNFTSTVCSTVINTACFSTNWYLKLVVDPGASLDRSNSIAANGTASTNF